MKRIAIIFAVCGFSAALIAAFLFHRVTPQGGLERIEPFVGRGGELEPVKPITARDSPPGLTTVTQNDDPPAPVGACSPGDVRTVERLFLSTPVRVDEGIERVPPQDDLRAMIALAAQVLPLLAADEATASDAHRALTEEVGPDAGELLGRMRQTQPEPFRIHTVLAIPPAVGGPSVRVKREDLDDMPPGTTLETIPLEVTLGIDYQTGDGTDRVVSIGFVQDAATSGWTLRSLGTIMDRGTMHRLLHDVEAQNKLIAASRFAPGGPNGALGVRRGRIVHLQGRD